MSIRKKPDQYNVNTVSRGSLTSPYNFVELNEMVFPAYEDIRGIPSPKDLRDDLVSGEIEYEVQAKTPVIYEYGNSTLNASMMRGLVRHNLQILGFTALGSDIEDRTYKYRSLANPANVAKYSRFIGKKIVNPGDKRSGRRLTVYDNIHAGIITKDKDGYGILPVKGDKPDFTYGYCQLNIRVIQRKYDDWRTRFAVSWENMKNVFDCLQSDVLRRTTYYSAVGKTIRNPFYKRISWQGKGNVTAVGEVGKYENSGFLLNPGYAPGNVSMYLIPDRKEAEGRIAISPEAAGRHSRYVRENIRNADQSHYDLPGYGEEKPVFYILYNGKQKVQFGFTRLFPIDYDHSVGDGLPQAHRSSLIDYDIAMFGVGGDERSYGGRLCFEKPDKYKDAGTCRAHLMLPGIKGQAYRNYVRDDQGLGYNADSFRLSGIKQYWLHNEAQAAEPGSGYYLKNAGYQGDEKGTCYRGKIRFLNLRDDELGLLLWSIGLNPEDDQNIGAGKAFGYGRVKITVSSLRIWEYDSTFPDSSIYGATFRRKKRDVGFYIRIYQKRLDEFLGGGLSENARLQSFFLMKDSRHVPDEQKTLYAEPRQYRQRLTFPKIIDVSSSKEWLIVPDSGEPIIPPISWDEFLKNLPKEMRELPLERDVVTAYQDLVLKTQLFRENHRYIIRKDILEGLDETYESALTLISACEQAGSRPSRYENLMIHVQTCIERIRGLKEEIDREKEVFARESVPVLGFKVESSSFDEEKKTAKITASIGVSEGSVPVLAEAIGFMADDDFICEKILNTYIDGGEKKYFEFEIPFTEEDWRKGWRSCTVHIDYASRFSPEAPWDLYVGEQDIHIASIDDYIPRKNPYRSHLGDAVSDQNMFFGRQALLEDIVARIGSNSGENLAGRNIIIYGQKRTGKSTLLHFIKKALEEIPDEACVVVNIGNIGSLDSEDSDRAEPLLRTLMTKTEDTFEDDYPDLYDELEDILEAPSLSKVSEEDAGVICESYFARLARKLAPDRRLVLLIDEFTYLYDWIGRGLVSGQFMRFWKAFIQNTKICAVLIGQDFMEDFMKKFPNEFAASDKIRITYLDRSGLGDLVQKPFMRENKMQGFSAEAEEEIFRLTAGNAYFAMNLCSMLVDYLNEQKKYRIVTPYVIERMLEEKWLNPASSSRCEQGFFHSLFNDGTREELNEDNLMLLGALAGMEAAEGSAEKDELVELCENKYRILASREKIERLIHRDVILEDRGKLKIRVQLFAKWLRVFRNV